MFCPYATQYSGHFVFLLLFIVLQFHILTCLYFEHVYTLYIFMLYYYSCRACSAHMLHSIVVISFFFNKNFTIILELCVGLPIVSKSFLSYNVLDYGSAHNHRKKVSVQYFHRYEKTHSNACKKEDANSFAQNTV